MAIGDGGSDRSSGPTGWQPIPRLRPDPPGTAVDGRRPARRRRRRPSALPYVLIAPAVAALAVMLGYPLVRLGDAVAPGVRAAPAVRRSRPSGSGSTTSAAILDDSYFWDVLLAHGRRSALVNVGSRWASAC